MGSLLVTGCMRTGTHYTAGVLTSAGLVCTHEYLYRHDWGESAWKERRPPVKPDGWIGEASWLAAPYLDQLPQDVFVLHQVRHPLKSLRCMLYTGILDSELDTVAQYVRQVLPECRLGSAVERACRYLYLWNERVENFGRQNPHRYIRCRVEDLHSNCLAWVLARAGIDCNEDSLYKAFESTPKDQASCGHNHDWELVWADADCEPLRDMARRYGYED